MDCSKGAGVSGVGVGVGRWGPGFLARGDVWEFISLFSTEGHIVKKGREVSRDVCHSQFYHERYDENLCVCGGLK